MKTLLFIVLMLLMLPPPTPKQRLTLVKWGHDEEDLKMTRDDTEEQQQQLQQHEQHFVASILSWHGWKLWLRLSFGVYLIHLVTLFIAQLNHTDKEMFVVGTIGMHFVSVCVISYALAAVAALLVKLPCANLWKWYVVAESSNL